MARMYTVYADRLRAVKACVYRTRTRNEPHTIYVVEEVQPPMFLVGAPNVDMETTGATALLTMYPGLPTHDGDTAEAKATARLLTDLNAELQEELDKWIKRAQEAERHLNPPLGANRCNPGTCPNVGDCCFCDREY